MDKTIEIFGIASDHGGFELKDFLYKKLKETLQIQNLGVNDETSVDYPSIIKPACNQILSKEISRLIALCGTGIGASIAANRIKGIRAALCHDEFTAEMSRRHNNSNVLVLGGRILGKDLALRIVQKWIETPFEGGRHQNRIEMLDQ